MTKTKKHEYTDIAFERWMLPGEWEIREVQENAQTKNTSFTMATWLHPNMKNKDVFDFWGRRNPYGEGKNLVFIRLVEFAPNQGATHRWSVVTGRNSHSDMSTNKFHMLKDAVQFMVNEMIKTTKKFDKINKIKSQIWDFETIIENDPNFNTVQ